MAVAEERSVATAIDDLTIRISLNDIFLREDADLYRALSFSVVEGRVLLKGSVTTSEDRARAIRLAEEVAGVREVIDELQVAGDGGERRYTSLTTAIATPATATATMRHVRRASRAAMSALIATPAVTASRTVAEIASACAHSGRLRRVPCLDGLVSAECRARHGATIAIARRSG